MGVPPGLAQERSPLTCVSCLVVDEQGRELWRSGSRSPAPMASTTKMLVALLTVRMATLEDEVRVSEEAAATPGGKLSLIAGERLSVEELLQALLLNSSNDAAVALAEHVSGSSEAFVRDMNLLARRLGAGDTAVVNPHGLDAPGHVSTARDLALLGRVLLEDEVLAEIVAMRAATIASDQRTAVLENTNILLGDYVGAVGIKTGFTALAGNVLVAAARRDDRMVVAVAMNSDDAFADTTWLLDRGFKELARTILVREGDIVNEIVSGGGAAVSVSTGDLYRGSELPDSISTSLVLDETLRAPLVAGDIVGEVAIAKDGAPIASVRAVVDDPLPADEIGWIERGLLSVLSAAGRLQTALGAS
jgi:D-alanyl-D-alanine carboxypeptidase (penicillin-binding protein 5/6)